MVELLVGTSGLEHEGVRAESVCGQEGWKGMSERAGQFSPYYSTQTHTTVTDTRKYMIYVLPRTTQACTDAQ